MNNRIELVFDKTITVLTGNPFGRNTYKKQIAPKISNYDSEFEVIIPDVIEDIGSSFVQGIYATISESIGKKRALQVMKLYSSRETIRNKIAKSIKTYGIEKR